METDTLHRDGCVDGSRCGERAHCPPPDDAISPSREDMPLPPSLRALARNVFADTYADCLSEATQPAAWDAAFDATLRVVYNHGIAAASHGD